MAEKKINGRTFKTTPVLARQALNLQTRIANLCKPSVDRLIQTMASDTRGAAVIVDGKPQVSESTMIALAGAITEIFGGPNADKVEQLVVDLIGLAHIQRPSGVYDPVDFDGDLTGHLEDMVPLLAFVLQEQFGSFLSGVLAIGNLGKLLKKA